MGLGIYIHTYIHIVPVAVTLWLASCFWFPICFLFSWNIEIQTGDWRGQRSSSYIYRNQWRHSFFKFMVLLCVFPSRPIFHSLGSLLLVFNFRPPNIHPTCYGPLDFIICGTTFHLSDQTPPNMSPSITLFIYLFFLFWVSYYQIHLIFIVSVMI